MVLKRFDEIRNALGDNAKVVPRNLIYCVAQ